ncbi:TPA: hypothetical protein ACSZAH_06050 [Listeria monocytogenes]
MEKVNKIKKTTKKVVKTVKKAGTKVINKATSKIKTVGKKANAIIAAGKEAAAKAKKEKADRKAAAKEALCKNQEFLESQKKGYSDPTYDYKAGYPRPDEVWAFDANGNIDKEKSAELAEKMGFWSSIAVGFIPGPLEIVLGKVAGTIVVKVGGKVGSKIISWGATKFGAKGAAKKASGAIETGNGANSSKNVALYEKYKDVLGTTEKANPLVDSLRETGKLPDNFISKDLAIEKGWRPGKALENYVPGGQIGGDIYQNSTKLLPEVSGRVWREADVGLIGDMSRAKQAGTRLLYSNDGLLYITTDHYKTMHFIGNY